MTTKGSQQAFISSRQITWLMLEALLPIALISIVFWPIASWAIPNQQFLYERYFGSGDLIAISITLISPLIIRLITKNQSENRGKEFYLGVFLVALIAIGGIIYGAIKIKYLSYSFPDAGQPDSTITDMSNFSWGFVIITIAAIFAATGMED
ncbi:hypothetical protein [Hydrogenophaga crassostreae]|uniref:hypothetical protein n=1 Tax=Hydrogenophaga crassostreae TaxID=1763535 RepID=UPI0012F85E6D|nr:hypothetical protein [Hydrogenophaga crassostreae]